MHQATTKNWGFCDLSVNKEYDPTKLSFIENSGFNTIAIDTYIEEANDEPKKKKKKGEVRDKQDFINLPPQFPKEITKNVTLNILQRVTIEFSDSSIAHKINQSENLRKYDIVAVVPKTLAAFQYACGTLDVDMISFLPQEKTPFKVNRKLYRQAVDRGIFFELMYSAALKDSTSRKNVISTAHNYHAVGKSKNIIITSGSDSFLHVRGIYDVTNIGLLFGLNKHQSLETIRGNARKLILKGHGRRVGKLYISLNNVNETENTDKVISNYIAVLFFSFIKIA